MTKRSFFIGAAILLGLLISVTLTLRDTWPLLLKLTSADDINLRAVSYGFRPPSDDYFYFAYVRSLIEYHFGWFDPVSYENRTGLMPHVSYRFSLLLAALPGMPFQSTDVSYYFTKLFAPLAAYLLIVLYCKQLTNRTWETLVIAAIVMLGGRALVVDGINTGYFTQYLPAVFRGEIDTLLGNQFRRIPNVLITNIHAFAFALTILRYWEKRSVPAWSLLIALTTVSPFVSAANFMLCAGIFLWRFILELPKYRVSLWPLIGVILSGVATLPGFFVLLRAQTGFEVLFEAGLPAAPGAFAPPTWDVVWGHFAIPSVLALIGLIRCQNRAFLASILLGCMTAYAIIGLTMGTFFSTLFLIRGGGELLSATLISAVAGSVQRRPSEYTPASYYAPLASALFVICIWGGVLVLQVPFAREVNAPYIGSDASDFLSLSRWLSEEGQDSDVVVTLDFDLLTNLPAYASIDMYTPMSMVSGHNISERMARLNETASFLGMSTHDYRGLLSGMTAHSQLGTPSDTAKTQRGLMQLVMFYGKYYLEPMSEGQLDSYMRDYQDRLAGPSGFTRHATLFVASKNSLAQASPASRAYAIMQNTSPLFENKTYAVYHIQ